MIEKSTKERAKALFEYLRELSALRQRSISNISDYPWTLSINETASDPENIEIFYRDRTEEEIPDPDPTIMRIHKPEFYKCPEISEIFSDWLYPGWEDYRQDATVKSEIISQKTGTREAFLDNPDRESAYNKWISMRNTWQAKQKAIERTRNTFSSLYQTYIDLNRDIETMEVVVANGVLRDRENISINHPLITRRVTIRFDASDNTISIEDLDVETELCTLLLQGINGMDLSSIPSLNNELHENDFHPLDRNDTPDYLKKLIQKLSSESIFSREAAPDKWEDKNRFLLYCSPVFMFRKRIDGTPKFLQAVADNIELTGWVPLPISETVSGGKVEIAEEMHEQSIEEQLAAVGGEDIDILLSKEANREQLEIAQRIAVYNAVLVQGPPGTGKTHTIANLLGHFLAQGMSVLVTSQTPKALQVLKDKVPNSIKPLCVSVINDSNIDMERSVDGITSFMSRYTSNELKKEAELLKADRLSTIKELAEVRKKIYLVIKAEANSIVIEGEEISPSKAAEFITKNEERLSYIPGRVKLYAPMPVSYGDLINLYKSNEIIGVLDEKELERKLPPADILIEPDTFAQMALDYRCAIEQQQVLSDRTGWTLRYDGSRGTVFNIGYGEFVVPVSQKPVLEDVLNYIKAFGEMETWMKRAAVDGLKGGAYSNRWEILINEIEKACECGEEYVGKSFGKTVDIADMDEFESLEPIYKKIVEIYERKGKISKFDVFANKPIAQAIEAASINGKALASKEDGELLLQLINLQKTRKKCASYWKELIKENDAPDFFELDAYEPERVAKEWIPTIRQNLSWYISVLDDVEAKISTIGIHTTDVFVANRSDTGLQKTDKILNAIREILPGVIEACIASSTIHDIEADFNKTKAILREGNRVSSTMCSRLVNAIEQLDEKEYKEAYKQLEQLYDKYSRQLSRKDILSRIAPIAPDWANAIENRIGVHGEYTVPPDIEGAWKWKQLTGIVSEIIATPYDELQEESLKLSKRYRELTGKYSEKLAWYHLLRKTENDIDMRQALNGWKLTVKKDRKRYWQECTQI